MAAQESRSDGISRAVALMGALGGAVTLITAAGGAITWLRFAGAKLPADQVVAVTPKEELITVGAVSLIGFCVVGLLAVLVVYLLDRCGTAGTRNRIGIVVVGFAGIVAAILVAELSTARRIGALVIASLAALVAYFAAHQALHRPGRATPATGRLSLPIQVGAVIAGVLVPAALALWLVTELAWIGVITAVAGVLGTGLLAVARATGSQFRWFGVTVFLAVLAFGGLMSALRTASTAKLQPGAVALNESAGGGGLSGLFVAETAERVYLADVDHCRRDKNLKLVPTAQPLSGTGRIMEIPRASVHSLSIGTRQRLELAEQRGPQLLAELRTRTATGTVPQQRNVATTHPCADEGVVDLTTRRFTSPSAAEAASLAEHFRPILHFDAKERWRPLNIAHLMAERSANGRPRHRMCALSGKGKQHSCEPIGGVGDLIDDPGANRIVDFDGLDPKGTDRTAASLASCPGRQAKLLLDCDGGPASAIYYRATRVDGRTYVDYWWFLRFNHFDKGELGRLCSKPIHRRLLGCYDHEGDWEGVTAVSARGNPRRLAFLNLASHEGVFRYATSELELEGNRPRVYIARGSHAAYPHPCARRCRQPHQRLPETNTDGSAPWGRNSPRACDDKTCLIALPDKGFNRFGGRWGSRACSGKSCQLANGPKTPARQRRYQTPWCFTGPDRRLTCDGSPPSAASGRRAADIVGVGDRRRRRP